MLSYLQSFFSNLFGLSSDNNDDTEENYLAEQLLNLEISEQTKNKSDTVGTPEIPRDAQCFQRTGVITYIDNDHIFIDGFLYFDLSSCVIDIKLNDKVVYLAYKDQTDSIKVVRILENQGMTWSDETYEDDVEETQFNIITHVIIGEVELRDKRFVYMKNNDLKFNLDDVEATFIPIKGDWLELKCNVQWDENNPSDITAVQVLEVVSFRAVRRKVKKAVITEWTGDFGTCDRQFYFDKQCLQDGIEPTVGSKVMIEAIESNQGTCTWRVLKLLLIDEERTVENTVIDVIDKEQISLDLEKEKNIDVTYPLIFENVEISETQVITLTITNNSPQTYVINKWIVLGRKRDSQVYINPILTRPLRLLPKDKCSFNVECLPKFLGHSKEHVIIMFRGFQVHRFVEINIINRNHNNLNSTPNTTFNFAKKRENMIQLRKKNNSDIVPGIPLKKAAAFIPVKLGLFPIPNRIWDVVLGDSSQTVHSSEFNKILDRIETNFPCLTQKINIRNYTDRWHTLLYMEEVQMNINMRAFDKEKVFLIRCQEYLGVEIASLSEKRPSIVPGDRVVVRDIWDSNSPPYEGFVHVIKGNLILMKFHQRFHETYSGSDVSIEFHFSRVVYRRAHQAIHLAVSNLGSDLLFPCRLLSRTPQLPPENVESIKWFNTNLNLEQKAAVTNILLGYSRPLPYCIFGPPGTGKTVTVIETILQILTMLPDSRILVATPSNSASNLITERLLEYRHSFSDSILRLIAHYLVNSETIPEVVRPFCATMDIANERTVKSSYTRKNGVHLNCQTSFIGRHRVTVGTCNCLGALAQMGLPKGHFTHIIIDEAGQATEPEIMIPMTFTDKENGQIILAGDPMQLGPMVISKYCNEYDMGMSFLSRVLEFYPYQKDFIAFSSGYNKKLVTKLNNNYRSLQEVINLPSRMFYDASLVANVDRSQPWIQKLLGAVSEILNMPETNSGGIYVNGIRGCNARADESPSWYNPQEASMVALTVCKLYKRNVSADDIGIITPYIAQTSYIKLIFEAMGLSKPKIGTVEEFQGQERPLIIISTVRTSESYIQEDQKNKLGFVKSPKRLNVALTRAQVAVLLFCDPHLLSMDQYWRQIIEAAVVEDKYIGCDLPPNFEANGIN